MTGSVNRNETPLTDEQHRMAAAAALISHTGASAFQIQYVDLEQHPGEPPVWIAASWHPASHQGGPGVRRCTALGDSAERATYALLEQLIDGGVCQHCDRQTLVSDSIETMALGDRICWYQYDPELKVYRRACADSRG